MKSQCKLTVLRTITIIYEAPPLIHVVYMYGVCAYMHLLSALQCNLCIEDTIWTQLAVLQRDVPNLEVDLYTALCDWNCRQYHH